MDGSRWQPWRASCLSSTSLFLDQVTSLHEEVQERCVRWKPFALTLFAAVSALFATAVHRHCDLRHWRDTFTVWVVHVKVLIFPAIPVYVCQFFHSTTGLVSATTLVASHCHWHLGIHFFRTILCLVYEGVEDRPQ